MHQKDTKINILENGINNYEVELSECETQVKNVESILAENAKKNSELQGIIQLKDTERKQATSLVEKVKDLHSEQCKEFEQQIELVMYTQLSMCFVF